MKGLTYEFVFPSQVFIGDAEPWPELSISVNGISMLVEKPIMGHKLTPVDQTLGNEGVVIEYSIFRVKLELASNEVEPDWSLPYYVCKEVLTWIRVVARQYWLGVLMSASDSFARGTIISRSSEGVAYKNFGASKMRLPPQPLAKQIWLWIGSQVQMGNKPAIPDVMFCDALLKYREDDYLQTVIQFGIICELELNALIDDLLGKQSEGVQKLYAASKLPFKWKLTNMPGILAIGSYQEHNARFFSLLCQLYELRGSAVHRAQALIEEMDPQTKRKQRVPLNFGHASQFLFAVDDFLKWSKQKRRDVGIEIPTIVAASPIPYLIGPAQN